MNHIVRTATDNSVLCIVTADQKQLHTTPIVGKKHYQKFTAKEKFSADELFVPGHLYQLNYVNGKYMLPYNGVNLIIPVKIIDRYA